MGCRGYTAGKNIPCWVPAAWTSVQYALAVAFSWSNGSRCDLRNSLFGRGRLRGKPPCRAATASQQGWLRLPASPTLSTSAGGEMHWPVGRAVALWPRALCSLLRAQAATRSPGGSDTSASVAGRGRRWWSAAGGRGAAAAAAAASPHARSAGALSGRVQRYKASAQQL